MQEMNEFEYCPSPFLQVARQNLFNRGFRRAILYSGTEAIVLIGCITRESSSSSTFQSKEFQHCCLACIVPSDPLCNTKVISNLSLTIDGQAFRPRRQLTHALLHEGLALFGLVLGAMPYTESSPLAIASMCVSKRRSRTYLYGQFFQTVLVVVECRSLGTRLCLLLVA